MSDAQEYILGQSARAARRLEIQDAHFGPMSERLLDDLQLQGQERVVEFGCGPGGFSRRIIKRLGRGGVLVSVDSSASLLAQARETLTKAGGAAHFEPVLAELSELGSWLDGADVVVGRAILHHIPLAELLLGRLLARLRPGTKIGFLEPDFRLPLARLALLESKGRTELAPLRVWANAINRLYQATQISPAVGATLASTLETAGCQQVKAHWWECRLDSLMVENMLMFYDEVRERLEALGILTVAEVERQQELIRALPLENLPAVWGMVGVTCVAG